MGKWCGAFCIVARKVEQDYCESSNYNRQLKMSYAACVVPDYDGQQWSDLDSDRVKALFKHYGAVLFRGFPGDINRFETLTNQFCDSYMVNPKAGRNPVVPQKSIETVNNGHGVFELHAERHQLPFSPHICFFYGHEVPEKEGETSYCDGSLLIGCLSEAVREFLQKKQLGTTSSLTWMFSPVPLVSAPWMR